MTDTELNRFTATPEQIMNHLRKNLAEDRLQAFLWAVGDFAVLEASRDLRKDVENDVRHNPLFPNDAEVGWLDAAKFLEDNLHYPSTLIHFVGGKAEACPGAPKCYPGKQA